MEPAHIDVHHHFLTRRYVEELARIGVTQAGGVPFPDWTPADSLAAMDRQGIATALLSLSSPGLPFPDRATARGLARALNEFAAEQVARYPTRFGFFAVLPLPDVDAALAEAAYALDTLGADGVGLLSNHFGIYPGDQRLEPLFDELDRRSAVAHVHPTVFTGSDVPSAPNAGSPIPTLPGSMLEFVFDTTRAVANLVLSGTLARHPNIRLVLSHAGGTVPFLANRILAGTGDAGAMIQRARTVTDPDALEELSNQVVAESRRQLQGLYYDTALSANRTILGPLRELAPSTHILAGTDLPFAPEAWTTLYLRDVQRLGGFHATELADNARELFPRLRR